VRDATSLLLASWGCRVVTAGSVQELDTPPGDTRIPDLIIADLRLRGSEDGISTIQTLRTRYGQMIPGVIITGDTMPGRLTLARDSGLPILHKPLSPAKLRELLNSLAAPVASAPR
jgi:two-component system, sensor histidine kinase